MRRYDKLTLDTGMRRYDKSKRWLSEGAQFLLSRALAVVNGKLNPPSVLARGIQFDDIF